MSKRFERNVIKFLELLHYAEEPGGDGEFKKKYFKRDSEYEHLLKYLERKSLVIKIPYKGINIFQLTDEGIEFLLERKKEKRQEEFNKLVAFTGAIIALIGIYTFIKDNFSFENYQLNFMIIKIVFLFLLFLCIYPLSKFVVDYWKDEIFGK